MTRKNRRFRTEEGVIERVEPVQGPNPAQIPFTRSKHAPSSGRIRACMTALSRVCVRGLRSVTLWFKRVGVWWTSHG